MAAVAKITVPGPATRPLIERGLKQHVSAFMTGRIELALPCYKLPLPVFVDDKLFVIETERYFVEMIRAYRHYVLKDGLQTVQGDLLGYQDNGDHLLVDTRFTFEYLGGRTNHTDSTRYIRIEGGRLIVEMVENRSFPHHDTLVTD